MIRDMALKALKKSKMHCLRVKDESETVEKKCSFIKGPIKANVRVFSRPELNLKKKNRSFFAPYVAMHI